MSIRVLMADDNESLRKWYAYALSQDEEIELLPMASNGYEAVSLAAIHKPDVIILDVEMELRDSGLMAGRQILSMQPDAKIIILTVYDDDATIFRAYEMGVIDYLFKDAPVKKLIEAIKNAHSDTTPIRHEIAKRMRSEFRRLKHSEDSLMHFLRMIRQLSDTECDVVIMLASGMSRQEICKQRFIEMSTLKTHIRTILRKMQVSNTTELVSLIEQENLLPYIKVSINPTGDETYP